MKIFSPFLILFFIPIAGIAQETADKQMSYNLTVDSLLAPDYYNVIITTAEYTQYRKISKRQYENIVVPIDTLSQRLLSHLLSLGFNQHFQKSAITEVDNSNNYYGYNSSPKLFQVTYSFRLTSKDSIDYLFKNIDRQIVSGIKISPELYEATIEKARQAMVMKGAATAEKYASQIAQQMNQKIIRSKYNIIFYDGGLYNKKFNDFNKNFVIDYTDIDYKVSISYSYTLADK